MTTTRLYQSTDASAPTLTGQAGSLIALLDAVLVGTSGVAYGSGGSQKLAAGWTKPFSGTNKAAFRNSLAAGGTGNYFRIDDTAGTAGGAREAVLKGYVSMSDVDTGIGSDVLPDTTLYSIGGTILKSDTANSTTRPWVIVADELTCWIWIESLPSFLRSLHGFGDIESDVASDSYRAFGLYQAVVWSGQQCASRIAGGGSPTMASPATTGQSRGLSVMRGYSGAAPGSVQCGCPVYGVGATNVINGTSGGASAPIAAATAPGSGEQYFTPAMACAEGMIRGRLRGLYVAVNDLRTVANGTLRSNASGLPSGSSLMLLHTNNGGNSNNTGVGVVAIETALSW